MTPVPPARTPEQAPADKTADAMTDQPDTTDQPDEPAGSTAGSTSDSRAAARSRAARRALALALLCGALGAALALVAAGQVWSRADASFAQGALPVSAKGSQVTGLPSALALVGLAALVAVFAVRKAGRLVVAALLALCGLGTLLSALFSADDTAALEDKAAETSGIAGSAVDAVHISAWPYVSVVGGALLVVAGLLALRYGAAWPSMSGSGRYERTERKPRRAARPLDPNRPEDLWNALDRGEDPTGSQTAEDSAADSGASPDQDGKQDSEQDGKQDSEQDSEQDGGQGSSSRTTRDEP